MRRILVAAACILLAACGTTSRQVAPAPSPPSRSASEPVPAAVKPAPAQASTGQRPGGYYKDDGPGDNPPPNLDAIPDAQPRAEPLHRFANEPYSALGQTYTPEKERLPFRQKGLASWYGRMFHGKNTSSGERYDMYAMTAAHPTLPIPSYARVTNLSNGKSVVVRVNDRGPFHPGRVIDLSYAAATRLGYTSHGHTMVEVESILPDEAEAAAAAAPIPPGRTPKAMPPSRRSSPAAVAGAVSPPVPVSPEASIDPIAALDRPAVSPQPETRGQTQFGDDGVGIFVQLGAFRTSDKAEGLRDRVRREIAWLAERLLIDASNGLYRLHAGPYGSIEDARAIAARVGEQLDLKPLVIRRSF